MIVPLFADFFSGLLSVLLLIMAVFMILLVLVQRGRGGGLAGALGGMGGSSAFGAKAGDVFTKITSIAATVWIGLCIVAAWYSGGETNNLIQVDGAAATADAEPGATGDEPALTAPAGEGESAPAAEGDAAAAAPAESSDAAAESGAAGDESSSN